MWKITVTPVPRCNTDCSRWCFANRSCSSRIFFSRLLPSPPHDGRCDITIAVERVPRITGFMCTCQKRQSSHVVLGSQADIFVQHIHSPVCVSFMLRALFLFSMSQRPGANPRSPRRVLQFGQTETNCGKCITDTSFMIFKRFRLCGVLPSRERNASARTTFGNLLGTIITKRTERENGGLPLHPSWTLQTTWCGQKRH